MRAFFYSSIDEAQVKLSNTAENFAKSKGMKVAMIDGYKNARMTEKLGLAEKLPAVVELRHGEVTKVTTVKSDTELESILG